MVVSTLEGLHNMGLLNPAIINDMTSQIGTRPPYPNADFSGKTIIVTGTNVGLGKEAVRHFVRLNAEKVIGAVRSIGRGEAAKEEIEAETGRRGVVELMECDLSSYASVKAFAANVAKLDRVDAVVLNAGIATEKFELFEDNESTITVNVVSTTLLALLLLPTLRSFATKWDIVPVLTVVGSGVHNYTKFPERKTPNSLATLNNPQTAVMADRYAPPFIIFIFCTYIPRRYLISYLRSYPVSKLLQLFAVREIADKAAKKNPFVILNTLNPGLCYTDLTRNATGPTYYMMKVLRALLAWTAEEGSRTLVHATTVGPESHGVFISGCKLEKYTPSGNRLGKIPDSFIVQLKQVLSPARKARGHRRKFGMSSR